jgi:two-component sensor histidine kinase
LDVSQAVPVGLILNESITNAIKYAFPGRRGGQVSVSLLEQENAMIALMIRDDGVGLPQDFNLEQSASLGMNLIQGLAAQLRGTVTISRSPGVGISILFPKMAVLPARNAGG